MNQAVLFNDDFNFNKNQDSWCFTIQMSGQLIQVYCHSLELNQLTEIDSSTRFDLEEILELWLENNEPEGDVIHIQVKNH